MARDRRYSTARWRRLRAQVLRRDGRRCSVADCTSDMSVPGMTHIDHVVEVKDGGPFWDPNNLRVVCRFHHYAKTVEVMGERQAGGVRAVAERGDLTPGDPRYCWRKRHGVWHHFNPMHGGDCEWPDCPHNEKGKP